MSNKLFWKSLLVSPAILGTALVLSGTANAVEVAQATPNSDDAVLEQLNNYSQEGQANQADQVNSVFQLRDVSPSDWAFEALRNLVEKYGCIAGYPDRTFRGNRAMTRYEFAAGMNACLQSIERLIAGGGPGVTPEELQQIKRLVQEFEAELATLGARVDNLEGRVAFLEDHQFSTTTKLQGEAIFALTDTFGGGGDDGDDDTQTVFGDRVRLTLNSSFSGKDRLVTRLAAGNLSAFDVTGDGFDDAETTQTFNLSPGGNDIQMDWLAYYFPLGKAQVYVAATGGIHSDYVANTFNPYFEDYDGGNGALSTFASESPIYRIGGGAGAAVKIPFGNANLSLGYLAGPDAADPSSGNGLFNGEYAALAQLDYSFNDRFGAGLTYVHGYHNDDNALFDLGSGGSVVGTTQANFPEDAYDTNSLGLELAFKLSETISISGFGAYTDVSDSDGNVWTYGAGVAFADMGKEGSVLGIFAGAPPYVSGEDDTPIHVEAYYKYKLNNNISITPGVIWLSNPDGDSDNDDAFVGTLRTTFTF